MGRQRALRDDDPQQGIRARAAGADALEEEIEIVSGDVSLCLLVNRRTRVMRVIDFRAGAQARKFELICEAADEHEIQRAFVVVEKDEALTWTRMGFEKEGSIPGFYKRSDGHLLGMEFEHTAPSESGTRIRIRQERFVPDASVTADDLVAPDVFGAPSRSATLDRGERAYQAGRRLVKENTQDFASKVKIVSARPRDIEKSVEHAQVTSRSLTGMEHFGRGSQRDYVLCTARGGFSLLVGIEPQPCFDNALLELLCAPRGDKEAWLMAASLDKICEQLKAKEVSSVFAIAPADSVELSAVWVSAGFRRTGRLIRHQVLHGRRVDCFVWSRRLAEPS